MRELEPKFVVYDNKGNKSRYGLVTVLKNEEDNSFYAEIEGTMVELSQMSADYFCATIEGDNFNLRSEDGDFGENIDKL